jgi:hypothetical protein
LDRGYRDVENVRGGVVRLLYAGCVTSEGGFASLLP